MQTAKVLCSRQTGKGPAVDGGVAGVANTVIIKVSTTTTETHAQIEAHLSFITLYAGVAQQAVWLPFFTLLALHAVPALVCVCPVQPDNM